MKKEQILCVIPARLKSTRFPHKVLQLIHGKPLVQWVYEAAVKADFFCDVIVAVDSPEVQAAVEAFEGKYVLTSPDCPTGTARSAQVVKGMVNPPDIILNLQADAPLVNTEMLEDLFSNVDPEIEVWTLKKQIKSTEEVLNPNVVKVIADIHNFALYFSRAPIPYIRNPDYFDCSTLYYKHIGLYAFRLSALYKMDSLPHPDIEQCEVLEQLRFLYHGMKIHVATTEQESVEVDTKEDLERVRPLLQQRISETV